jgi:hypothetical protein
MLALVVLWLSAAAAALPPPCTGDCDGDTSVSVDEIVTAIAVALGDVPATACPAADRNGDHHVTVDELVASLDAALHGCPPTPDLPDLVFSSVAGDSLGYSCADDARNPRLRLCLTNRGGDAGPFPVRLESFQPDLDIWHLRALAAGAEACLQIPLFDSVRLQIDPDDAVTESREDNNTHEIFLPTLTRGPGCTPTPTPAGPDSECCQRADSCGGRSHPAECFRSGGTGLPAPFTCDPSSGRCVADGAPTPEPTATPSANPPDLVPDILWPCSFSVGCSPSSGSAALFLACVENAGSGPSPASELAIGSYWSTAVPPLEAGHRECFRAPRIDRGRIVADPGGRVGESDESNNVADFSTID